MVDLENALAERGIPTVPERPGREFDG